MFLSEDREELQKLIDNKIPFYITMGYAVNFHTGKRALHDVDVVVNRSDLEQVSKILECPITVIEKRGDMVGVIISNNVEIGSFSYFAEKGVNFEPSTGNILGRCESLPTDPQIRILGVNDLIVKKLFYGRKKDLNDVANLIKASVSNGKLNPLLLIRIIRSTKAKSTILKNAFRSLFYLFFNLPKSETSISAKV